MAYIEIAPQYAGENKKHDKVAGCLIAFACRLSFTHGQGDFHGWLSFDIIWNKDKATGLKEFITAHFQKQSKERLLRNKLLSIQYQMEDYLENDGPQKKMLIPDFVKLYIKFLNTTQRRIAELFEMKDSNLHKYLTGERKLNADLVLKLSSFSHTDPEYWLRAEVKN